MSRTVHLSSLARRNFESTARFIVDNFETLPLNLSTALLLMGMINKDRYPDQINRDYTYKKYAPFGGLTDAFVSDNPIQFYEWLESPEAENLWKNSPLEFAEILHNNISILDSFLDGNGRLSRFLADLALLKAGLAPALYTNQWDYFYQGNPRSPQSREARKKYFAQIVEQDYQWMQKHLSVSFIHCAKLF